MCLIGDWDKKCQQFSEVILMRFTHVRKRSLRKMVATKKWYSQAFFYIIEKINNILVFLAVNFVFREFWLKE